MSDEPERKEDPRAWVICSDSFPDERSCPIGLCNGSGTVYTYPEPMAGPGSAEAMPCPCASGSTS